MHNNRSLNIQKKLVIVILVMTPVGIIIMLNSALRDKYLWTTTIFLTLQFLSLLIYLFLKYHYKPVIFVIPALLVCGFVLEYVGVKTSFPFGSYSYSEILQPQILNVPIAISISWVVVVVSSFLIVSSVKSINSFSMVVYSAILVLGFDFMLEPFASFVNSFWIWSHAAVPVQNYISWFIVGILFSYFLKLLLKENTVRGNKSGIISNTPLIIYLINVLQFTVINFANGFLVMTLFGLLLISLTLTIIYRKKYEI